MYSNILVPVVFEHEPSVEQALAVANELLAEGGKITLLHVVEEIPSYAATMIPKEVWANSVKSAQVDIRAYASKYQKSAHTDVIKGHSSRAILDYGEEHNCDCVVIASHKPGLEDYFLGSTAARVVRHAKCAVHILR